MKKMQFCLVIVLIVSLSCQIALAKEKLTAQDRLQKGMSFEKQGSYEEAIDMYTRAIMLDKNYTEAYMKRARAYMLYNVEYAMESLADFTKAIDIDPTNGGAYYERGLLHAYLLFNEAAVADMRKAASLGHKGAQKWLDSHQGDKSKKKESSTVAPDYEGEQKAPAAGAAETGMENKSRDLGEYMPSGSKPIIHFDFNMSNIKPQYFAILNEVAMVLNEKVPEANIVLAGHTDSIGTENYNENLSLQRAKAVEAYLTDKYNIPSARMSIKGYGKSNPLVTNETSEGRAEN
jgi:outer membrane protein OmpA-like peptidoglycan-associated protein